LLFQVLDLLFFVCLFSKTKTNTQILCVLQAGNCKKKRRKAEKQTNKQLQQQPTQILTAKKKTIQKKRRFSPLQLENTEMIKKCTNY